MGLQEQGRMSLELYSTGTMQNPLLCCAAQQFFFKKSTSPKEAFFFSGLFFL